MAIVQELTEEEIERLRSFFVEEISPGNPEATFTIVNQEELNKIEEHLQALFKKD